MKRIRLSVPGEQPFQPEPNRKIERDQHQYGHQYPGQHCEIPVVLFDDGTIGGCFTPPVAGCRMRLRYEHPNFYFEKINSPLSGGISPAAAKSAPADRAAAGTSFKSALAPAMAADRAAAPHLTDPAVAAASFSNPRALFRAGAPAAACAHSRAAAGNEFRAATRKLATLSAASSPYPYAFGSRLERSKFVQAVIDVIAVAFIAFFICLCALAGLAALFVLIFVRL